MAAWLLLALPLPAQEALTLQDAVGIAVNRHPSMEGVAARQKAAVAKIQEARGGYLPKVSYQESWTRSDNPVFVFSSLLTQHQFTTSNFQIGPLNRPDAMNNFQSQVTLDQVIYDGRQVRSQVKSAELGKQMTDEEQRATRMGVVAGVIRAYYGAVLANESLQVAHEAVRSAEADLDRARSIRKAGMSTDADVLSIQVHLAAVREQEIRSTANRNVALAAVNEALGLPLDTPHRLTTPLSAVPVAKVAAGDTENTALKSRPEARQVTLATEIAATQLSGARGALLPQVGLHAGFEADRQRFVDRGGADWLLMASLKWNIFNGNSDKARIEEAREQLAGAKAQQRQLDQAIRLQVRRAQADLEAANERITVENVAVSQAEESLRITKNRYDSGLTTVTDLLRNETALLEVRTRRLSAVYDQRVSAAMLEQAMGTLSENSSVAR